MIFFLNEGTTWIEEIGWLIKNNLDYETSQKFHHFLRVTPFEVKLTEAQEQFLQSGICKSRIYKCHLPLSFLPNNIEKKCKVKFLIF